MIYAIKDPAGNLLAGRFTQRVAAIDHLKWARSESILDPKGFKLVRMLNRTEKVIRAMRHHLKNTKELAKKNPTQAVYNDATSVWLAMLEAP